MRAIMHNKMQEGSINPPDLYQIFKGNLLLQ